MKLNPDCIRAVLLNLEANLTVVCEKNGNFSIAYHNSNYVIDDLKDDFDKEDIIYSIKQLYDGGFIEASYIDKEQLLLNIKDITPDGHKFIENSKDLSLWNKTKELATEACCASLATLNKIGISVASDAVAAVLKKSDLF